MEPAQVESKEDHVADPPYGYTQQSLWSRSPSCHHEMLNYKRVGFLVQMYSQGTAAVENCVQKLVSE